MARFQSLSDAIVNGDVNSVRSLLSSGTSPNEPCKYGSQPLFLAMGHGIDIVKLLIDAGANVNATDSKGDTGLHRAISYVGNVKYLKLLLSAGASPNIANHDGCTPLLHAVKWGNVQAVQELINGGASVDHVDSRPDIRLHMALLQKDWDTVQSLLRAGAPTNYINARGESPLTLAIAAGRIELVQQLIDAGADVKYLNDKEGRHDGQLKSPLHDAVRGCNVEIVKLLLERGADPNRAKLRWYSVLSTATRIERNRIPILNLLLDHGADMYNSGFRSGICCDGINDLPFEGMVETNYVEGVRLFLERGFDMDKYQAPEPAGDRPTALHVALQIRDDNSPRPSYSDTRMLSLLLDHYRTKGTLSTELQRGLDRSWSPLFYAIGFSFNCPYERVAVLLKAGADPNLVDDQGSTALDYVLFRDTRLRYRGIQVLIEFGAHLRNFIERLVDEANAEDADLSSDEDSDGSSDSEDWDSDEADREHSDPNHWDRFIRRYARRVSRSMKKALCIVKYRILYEIENTVDEPVAPKLAISARLEKFHQACNAEIDFLRTHRFENSVTYYDVLMDKEFWRRVKSSAAFVKSRCVFSNSTPISNRILIYMDDLKDRWSSGYDKYKFWRPAMKGLERLLGIDKDTYYLIFSNVLNCLDVEDWRSLSEIATVADYSDARNNLRCHSNS